MADEIRQAGRTSDHSTRSASISQFVAFDKAQLDSLNQGEAGTKHQAKATRKDRRASKISPLLIITQEARTEMPSYTLQRRRDL